MKLCRSVLWFVVVAVIGVLAVPCMGQRSRKIVAPASENRTLPRTCRDIQRGDSGVYRIQPEWPFGEPMLVYCDQDYEDGGWTVVQRRIDGGVEFDRFYPDYAEGFGTLDGEFWLGLDRIYRLTFSAPHELVLWFEEFSGSTHHARYAHPNVLKTGSLSFTLQSCGSYSGDAGNALCTENGSVGFDKSYQNGGGFWPASSCNLNGRYITPNETNPDGLSGLSGLYWGDFKPGTIKKTKIMIRPTRTTD